MVRGNALRSVSSSSQKKSYALWDSRRRAALAAALATSLLGVQRGMATQYIYTPMATTGDLWSTGTDWTGGIAPLSAATTELTFVGTNTTLVPSGVTTTTDNITGPFNADILDLQGTGPASGSAATINIASTSPATGLALVNGSNATSVINLNALNGSSGLAYNITAPVSTSAAAVLVTGNGSAGFLFSGGLTTAGYLYKTGTSTLTLGGTTTIAGNLIFGRDLSNNGNSAGMIVASSGAVISIGSGTGNNILVAGNTAGTTTSSAVLDMSNAASFTANVNSFYIGDATTTNSLVNGTVIFGGQHNNITAVNSFEVGDITSAQLVGQNSLLQLANGAVVNIKTNRFLEQYAKANGSTTMGTNATFNLSGGASGTRAEMDIGNMYSTATSSNTSGTFDASASGDVVNLYLSFLVIGSEAQSSPSNTGNVSSGMILSSSNLNHLDLSSTTSVVNNLGVLTVGRQNYSGGSAANQGVAIGTLTINGLDNTSSIVATDNGNAIVVGTQNATTFNRSFGTINFNNSGTLTITTTGSAITGNLQTGTTNGISTVNFNGMTIKAGASTAAGKQWINNLTNANIGDRGAIFDTGGFNVNTNQVFNHGTGVYNVNATDGGITKNGLGTLTMSGTSTYNGPTTINAGTLNLTGGLTLSTINIQNGATLNLAGTAGQGINVNTGSTLSGEGTASGLLSFNGNDALTFDPTTVGSLTTGSVNAASGTVVITPTSSLVGNGLLVLAASGGITGSIGTNFIAGARGMLYFDNPAAPTELFYNTSSPASLTWQGSDATHPTYWDLNTTANFNNSGTTDVFFNKDSVLFDDTASSFTVNVQGILQPASVTFNNSLHNYTLQGGAISGATSLAMTGTGTVIVTNTNTYTGGTTISSGAIQLGDGTVLTGTLGTGTVTNNGTLVADFGAGSATFANSMTGSGAFNVTGPATLHVTGASPSYTGTTTISNGTLELDSSGSLGTGPIVDSAALLGNTTVTLPNNISGSGSVTVGNSSIVTYTGSNTYTGNTTISAGSTLSLGAGGTSGNISGGAISNSGTLNFNRSDSSLVGAPVTGTGSIVLNAPGTFTLSGVNTAGNVTIGVNAAAGTIVVPAGASLTVGTNSSTGSLIIGQTAGTNLSTGTLDASAASGFVLNLATVLVGNNPTTAGSAGTGTLKIPVNSSITAGASFQVGSTGGAFGSTSTVTTANGAGTVALLTPQLFVGFQKSHGTLTVGTGNTLTINGLSTTGTAMFVGDNQFNGTGSWSGLFDGTAGTVMANLSGLVIGNKVSGTGASFLDGQFILGNSASNHLAITGPTTAGGLVTIGTVGSTDSAGSVTGTMTIGNSDATSNITTTDSGPAILVSSNGTNGTTTSVGTGVVNLNGGTLTFNSSSGSVGPAIKGGGGLSTLNLNGDTIAAGLSNSNFITGLSAVNIRNGGVTLDSGNFNLSIGQNLSHSATGTIGAVTITSAGSGYTAVPTVTVTGGNATGFTGTGTATIDGNGDVTGVILNNVQNFSSAPTITISGGNGTGATATAAYTPDNAIDGGLTKISAGTLTLSGSNTYTGNTNINGGTLVAANNSALGTGQANLAGGTTLALGLVGSPSVAVAITNAVNVPTGSATLQLAPTTNFSSGSVGVVTVGSAATLSLTSPTIAGATHGVLTATSISSTSGTLDLGRNDLDLTGQSVADVTALVKSGFNNGSWTGLGITSSTAAGNSQRLTALGVIQNGTLFGANAFDGITPGAGDTLVKYTYYGDTNLDGKVDASDYSRIDNAYANNSTSSGPLLTGWYNGDFNYDGVINGSDYTLIDNAFNTQGSSLAAELASPTAEISSGVSAVPEPSILGLLGVAALGALGRRRRYQSGR